MTIQTIMMVALGFMLALLLVLLILPYYRRRVQRLTAREIKRTLPLTEAEITADKDRIRADYAVKVHKLEARVEEASLSAARQSIEINRRDAMISGLEGEVRRLGTALEEHENARRVLEQTIMDRLPKVEHRLAEAKKLLFQRDREISVLTQTAEKQSRALDEATQINTQQRDEIHRLGAALTTRAARSRDGLGSNQFDGEVALRSEIEALRDKTRDQAQLITRLQNLLTRAGQSAEGLAGRDAAIGSGIAHSEESEREIARLRADLAEAEAALRAARSSDGVQQGHNSAPQLEAQNRALKASNQDQASEIARLKAELAALQAGDTADGAGLAKESKIAVKARLAALEAQNSEQGLTIQSLRAEIAAANERLARQASHFREEIRRLGAGTVPTTADPRRAQPEVRRSLTDRINDPRRGTSAADNASEGSRAAGFLRAIDGPGSAGAELASGSGTPQPAPAAAAAAPDKRPRLLERITGIEKPSA